MFPEYIEVAKSLKKWKQQIINSFIRDNDGKRITNQFKSIYNSCPYNGSLILLEVY